MSKKYCSTTLPCEYNEMEKYILKNKTSLTLKVVDSIEYALKNKLVNVEVFKFKNSEYIVLLNESSFKENLDFIFNYYIETEQYEYCENVKKIQKLLDKKHNEQKKRHKPKGSSKHKD